MKSDIDVKPLKIILPDKDALIHRSSFLSNGSVRALVLGASESGKTTLLTELLPALHDFTYLLAYIRDENDPIYSQIFDIYRKDPKKNVIVSKDPPDFEKLLEAQDVLKQYDHNVIIMDDLTKPMLKKDVLYPFFSQSRHLGKKGCSVIILNQNWSDIGSDLRKNANLIILFETPDNYRYFYNSYPNYFGSFERYKELMKKIYQRPHNFMSIHLKAPYNKRVREHWGGSVEMVEPSIDKSLKKGVETLQVMTAEGELEQKVGEGYKQNIQSIWFDSSKGWDKKKGLAWLKKHKYKPLKVAEKEKTNQIIFRLSKPNKEKAYRFKQITEGIRFLFYYPK